MSRVASGLSVLLLVLSNTVSVQAYCRRSAPIWSAPIRVVIHPDMHNHIRHPFVNSSGTAQENFPCTTSADCGTDGLCSPGFPMAPTSRCRGARWTRSELERAVEWVVGRINNDTPANIPFIYVDHTNTHTCVVVDPTCGDGVNTWVDCYQSDTVTIMPTNCDVTQLRSASWNGSQWLDGATAGNRNQMVLLEWSGSATDSGVTWEHTNNLTADHFPSALLHEISHGLGIGHPANDDPPGQYPVCVPASPTFATHCPSGAWGTCPVMTPDRGEGRGLHQHFHGFDDIQGLAALYGIGSSPDTRLFRDADITTASWSELTVADFPLISDITAAPRPPLTAAGRVLIGGRERSVLFMQRFPVYEYIDSPNSTTLVTTFSTPSFLSTGAVGIAASSTDRMLSTNPPRLTNDARMWRRQVHAIRRPISGGGGDLARTFNAGTGSAADTVVPGVSSFYHAATNSWLHVLRDTNGQVLLLALRPDGGTFGSAQWSLQPLGFRSFATPSIACSPNRCFVAFVEVPWPLAFGSTQTRLQWAEGPVTWPAGAPVNFAYAGVTTSWYNVVSDPVASVVQNPGGGWYFYVAASWPERSGGVWGTRVLTYRKSESATGTNALVQMTPLLPHMPGVVAQPAAGGTGSVAALFTSSWK